MVIFSEGKKPCPEYGNICKFCNIEKLGDHDQYPIDVLLKESKFHSLAMVAMVLSQEMIIPFWRILNVYYNHRV